ncbi:MAG: hypothetical protein JWN89_542 [Parcubacteria group bacterium]|nr:hypothetical protein [Parcubacteria group bacterium]
MKQRGFTLVEILVGVTIFVIVAMAIYQSYASVYATVSSSHFKILASDLANEEFEVVRNLPYANVGEPGGIPNGIVPHVQTIVRDNISFQVTTTIRNVDDPFDGRIGATPNDTSPADYKLVEVEVLCGTCKNFAPVIFTGRVSPRNLETASTNGALFVQTFDANGQPVSDADVHIANSSTTPTLTIDDTTNAQGILQIVDVPPFASSYRISVSKPGYSTDQTYPLGGAGNSNPTKPHATVALQQVTQVSFAIDKTSTLNVSTVDSSCSPVSSIPFTMKGSKLIGTPSVYKYNQNLTTDSAGQKTISNLEWDTYSFTNTSATWELIGTNPLLPLAVLPNSNQPLQLVFGPKNPNTLLVSVSDSSTGLPISGASVTISNGSPQTLLTGRGSITQSDWSGGSGQATSSDPTKYQSSLSVSTGSPAGDVKISQVFGSYAPSGELISSAFDTGTTSTFQEISWNPTSEPAAAGPNSVKFQFASNNDGGAYAFVGPDGTGGSYYTLSERDLSTRHANSRYAKYKLFLSTASSTATPNLSDVSFTFTSGCVPPGQVAFSGLSSGTYSVTVSEPGYTTYTGSVSVSSAWQSLSVILAP